nr:Ig-like domain-containing protein [Escherichia coli]
MQLHQQKVEFTADSNSARQRETVTAPSLGAVEEISAGVYRSVLTAGSQAGTVRVTAKVQGKTFTLNIKQAAITDSDVSTAGITSRMLSVIPVLFFWG